MKLKVAFTGPESSGKTTISRRLAELFKGVWIEEYAREYLKSRVSYQQIDLDEIARVQQERWLIKNDLIVADTDMTVIKIWSDYRYGYCSDFIVKAYHEQQFDHYFLCKPDIPWEYDPLRENPDNRGELFQLYLNELQGLKRPFTILHGSIEERLSICKNVMKSINHELNS